MNVDIATIEAAVRQALQFNNLLIACLLSTPLVGGIIVSIIKNKRAIEIVTSVAAFLLLIEGAILTSTIIEKKSITAFNGIFYIDSLGIIIVISIAIVGFVSSLHSISYIRRQYDLGTVDKKHYVRYYQGFNIFLFTMILVPIANNAELMWAAIEATTLISVLLIMIYVKNSAIEASWKYLVIATVGLSFALFGTVLFDYSANAIASFSSSAKPLTDNKTTIIPIGKSGDINSTGYNNDNSIRWNAMTSRGSSSSAAAWHIDPTIVKVAFIFILIGYGTKAGLAPMHTWLPDAHSEAPTPVSALLSGVLLNCAMYGIMRFHIVTSNVIGSSFSSQLLIIFGILSAGIAAASIYFQKDMKRMLAYSSVEHMGIISTAIGFGGFLGIYGAILHIINHAIVKPLMFLSSGSISQKYDTKSIEQISGVAKTMPITGILFLIGGMAILGIPPFNMFVSEFLIFSSGIQSGQYLAFSLLLSFLVIIFAGFIRHLIKMIFGSPSPKITRGDMGKLSVIPMLILAALAVILGLHVPHSLHILTNQIANLMTNKP